MRKLVLLGLLIGFWLTPSAAAQNTVAPVQNAVAPVQNTAVVNFPLEITFQLELPPDHNVVSAALTYDVNKFSCLEADIAVPVDLSGDTLSWTLELVRAGNIPPGASLWWEWTLIDANGNTTTTPRQTVTLTDDRFNWQTTAAEGVSLHWYEGNVGPQLLDAAVDGLDVLESEMGIELQNDVQIFVYGSAADMRDALLYVQDWAGGVAFSEFNIILLGIAPSQADGWGREVVPHELAHLVVGQFGRSCVGGSRPTWLEEGLAMVAEGEPGADLLTDLANGVNNDAFAPLRSLNGAFASDHSQAGMAYSQSYSVVDYLLETYGQEKMQTLIETLAAGAGYDEALTAVYGVNVDGLEVEWRAAIGAPPRAMPPTPTPLLAAAVPTIALSGLPQSVPTPPAAAQPPPDNAGARPGISICGVGLLLPLLLVTAWRRRKTDG